MVAKTVTTPSVSIQPPRLLSLHNTSLTVQIAPEIGRIYAVILLNKESTSSKNLLWHEQSCNILLAQQHHQYVNWGGDKLWPLPQSLWARQRRGGGDWPPIPPVDGGVWQVVRQSPLQLIMRSQVDDALGIQVTRTITLDPITPHLIIHNRITRIKTNPLPVMIWCVTQVHVPEMTLLNIASDRPAGEWPVVNLADAKHTPGDGLMILSHAARCLSQPTRSYKLGTFGRWIAAVYQHHILLQTISYNPGACYPDRTNIQLYNDSDYIELETLSPSVHLHASQSISNTVNWYILDRTTDNPIALVEHCNRIAASQQPTDMPDAP